MTRPIKILYNSGSNADIDRFRSLVRRFRRGQGLTIDAEFTWGKSDFFSSINGNPNRDMTIIHAGKIGGIGAYEYADYCRKNQVGGLLVGEGSVVAPVFKEEVLKHFDEYIVQASEEDMIRLLQKQGFL